MRRRWIRRDLGLEAFDEVPRGRVGALLRLAIVVVVVVIVVEGFFGARFAIVDLFVLDFLLNLVARYDDLGANAGVEFRDRVDEGTCPADVQDRSVGAFLPLADAVVEAQQVREAAWLPQKTLVGSHSVRDQFVGDFQELLVNFAVVPGVVVPAFFNS